MKFFYTILFTIINFSTSFAQNDTIAKLIGNSIETSPIAKPYHFDITKEQITKAIEESPSFAVFKDTYFTTGIPLNRAINGHTADVLFQISVRQRLTKSLLPFNTFLYLTYSQKSFWNVYEESAPFKDNNYNPSIGLGKYIIEDNKLLGSIFVQFEHESNGRDEEDSRSWNRLSASAKYFYNPRMTFGLKVWAPVVDKENNNDLIDYKGFSVLSMNYITKTKRWWFTAELNPRKKIPNINTTLTAAFKLSRNDNQYLFCRFFSGTGESLLSYNRYDVNIRFGFCIKPDFGSIF